MARRRLDAELVRRGLARSREHAQELVSDGRVRVAGATATKPATQVEEAAALVVVESATRPVLTRDLADYDRAFGLVADDRSS